MRPQLISWKTAKLAKEIGFKDYTDHEDYYDGNGHLETSNRLTTWNDFPASDFLCDASTQSVLHQWIRDEHGMYVSIYPLESGWAFDVRPIKNQPAPSFTKTVREGFSSYEDALEQGLFISLKLIKNERTDN